MHVFVIIFIYSIIIINDNTEYNIILFLCIAVILSVLLDPFDYSLNILFNSL